MESPLVKMTTKTLFAQSNVRAKFEEMLGKKATSFITSVLQIASQNEMLSKADPMSIYNAAAVAATLDLPLNNNLGFAYIVPYNVRQPDGSSKVMAQLQIGAKGFKQLALRTGQFQTIHDSDVREGEIKYYNRLSGEIEFKWIEDEKVRLATPIIGFVSYFKLLTGYEQTFYMTIEKVKQHGGKYSKTFSKQNGLWNTDFESMAHKTVLKLNLSKNAPLSIDIQKAINTDQAVINNEDATDVIYVDQEAKQLEDNPETKKKIGADKKNELKDKKEKDKVESKTGGGEQASIEMP